MLLPLLVWASTGAVFLLKPGYDKAYAGLEIRRYPPSLADSDGVFMRANWQEARRLQSVLGAHLLVRENDQWTQRDLQTLKMRMASESDVRRLIDDALSVDSARYGTLISLVDHQAVTDTGVVITLDWHEMTLTQRGDDTRFIKQLYRLHYLQWTGVELIDRVLGVVGLILLWGLTFLGIRLFFFKAP